MIVCINTTRDISKLSQITYNNFEISLVVFMPNITTNDAITYTNAIESSTICGIKIKITIRLTVYNGQLTKTNFHIVQNVHGIFKRIV